MPLTVTSRLEADIGQLRQRLVRSGWLYASSTAATALELIGKGISWYHDASSACSAATLGNTQSDPPTYSFSAERRTERRMLRTEVWREAGLMVRVRLSPSLP